MSIKDEINQIPIKDVARTLGIEVIGDRGRCFNRVSHRNGDRNPSLVFGISRNVWKCSVCNFDFKYPTSSGYGKAIDLVMLYNNIDYKDALRWFKETYSLQGDISGKIGVYRASKRLIQRRPSAILTAEDKKPEKKDNTKSIEIYTIFIQHLGKISDIGRNYLKGRGLSDFIIDEYKLTDIKDNKKSEAFLQERFLMEDLIASGVFKISDKTKNPYFNFFNTRLMFPFYENDSVVYIQGRGIEEKTFRNTASEIPCLYNVNMILSPDVEGENVYITEGVIDCLSLLEMNYNAVGVIGIGNFKKEWTKLLRNVKVFLAFDNESDPTIEKAVEKAIQNIADWFAEVNGQAVKYINPKDLKGFESCKDWNDVLVRKLKNKKLIKKEGE